MEEDGNLEVRAVQRSNGEKLTYVVDSMFFWDMFRNTCEHVDAVLREEQRPTKIWVIAY